MLLLSSDFSASMVGWVGSYPEPSDLIWYSPDEACLRRAVRTGVLLLVSEAAGFVQAVLSLCSATMLSTTSAFLI